MMTLTQAISAFRRKHKKLYMPGRADGNCSYYSYLFIRFLQENFVFGRHLAREVHYHACTARHHPLRPPILTVSENEQVDDDYPSFKDRPCGAWASHTVVRIGRLRVDWTARQFDSKAPVPLVWRTKS